MMSESTAVRLTPTRTANSSPPPRWRFDAIAALFELPFNDLLFRAQEVGYY
jgi:hypothetical protein